METMSDIEGNSTSQNRSGQAVYMAEHVACLPRNMS